MYTCECVHVMFPVLYFTLQTQSIALFYFLILNCDKKHILFAFTHYDFVSVVFLTFRFKSILAVSILVFENKLPQEIIFDKYLDDVFVFLASRHKSLAFPMFKQYKKQHDLKNISDQRHTYTHMMFLKYNLTLSRTL